jgi:hypothetical protein
LPAHGFTGNSETVFLTDLFIDNKHLNAQSHLRM